MKVLVRWSAAVSVALAAGSMPLGSADDFRYVPNEAFGFGERLEFRVGYKFITAGRAYFQIAPQPIYREGRPCYDVWFEVRSLEALDWLYRVRDRYRTVLDVAGIFPWEFEQHLREGNYQRDFWARFDQRSHKAITSEGTFDVPPYVHDIVSAFYYVRTLNLGSYTKGSVIMLQNFFDKQTYDLGVRVLGRQTISVAAGMFRCIVIEPLIKEGGLFKSEGRILIWLSDDDRKIPIKVSTKIPIGTIDAELTGYSGLRGPLTARIAQAEQR